MYAHMGLYVHRLMYGGRVNIAPVTTQIRTVIYVEIISSVAKGDEVYVRP